MRRGSAVGSLGGALVVAAGILVGGGMAAAQSAGPASSPGAPGTGVAAAVQVCVGLVGHDASIDPGVLTPATLTQGIVDGSISVISVDGPCPSPGSSGGPAASLVPVSVSLEARDLSFTPHDLSVPAGQPATIDFSNAGYIVHNLTIDELGIQAVVSPGGTQAVSLPALPPGTYTFYCSISGHRGAGMEGTLTVR